MTFKEQTGPKSLLCCTLWPTVKILEDIFTQHALRCAANSVRLVEQLNRNWQKNMII